MRKLQAVIAVVMAALALGCAGLGIFENAWCFLGTGLFGYAAKFYREVSKFSP
jgi:hypothetical protein